MNNILFLILISFMSVAMSDSKIKPLPENLNKVINYIKKAKGHHIDNGNIPITNTYKKNSITYFKDFTDKGSRRFPSRIHRDPRNSRSNHPKTPSAPA